jgi:hypothetical protein
MKELFVKIGVKFLNAWQYMRLPLPTGIIEWGILRLWETPRLMLVVATAIRPECLGAPAEIASR